MRDVGRVFTVVVLVVVLVAAGIFISKTVGGNKTDVSATATAYVASQPRIGTTVAIAPSATPQPPAPQQPAAQPPRLVQCLDGTTKEVCPTVAPTNTAVVPTSTPIPAPTNTPVPQQAAAAPNTPVPQQAVQAPVSQPVAQQKSGLSVAEVRGWCSGSGCSSGLFEQVNEGGGSNPNAVHFKVGAVNVATFAVPPGVTVEGWDCFKNVNSDGSSAVTIRSVCEATFRRFG